MSRSRRLVALSAALGLAATGLVSAGTASTASVARGDATGATVDVYIDANRTVTVDQTLRAGVTRFVVRSERQSGFQLAEAAAGYTKRELTRDIQVMFENMRALRRFERNVTLHGGVFSAPEEPATMWVDLDPGTYWAVDVNDMSPTPAEVVTIRVAGSPTAADMPSGPVIRAVGHVDWAPRPKQIPAQGRMTFRNDSVENHHLIMARLKAGQTMADFEAWVDSGLQGPPPVSQRGGLDTGVVSPGGEMALTYSLRPGRYVMVCFWPDAAMDGMPHLMMGMYRMIRVG